MPLTGRHHLIIGLTVTLNRLIPYLWSGHQRLRTARLKILESHFEIREWIRSKFC